VRLEGGDECAARRKSSARVGWSVAARASVVALDVAVVEGARQIS
jgi:hypothetical protein